MITTVTLNPSFDLTFEVETLGTGTVVRASSERLEAAGKGVNVTRALAANGVPTRAVAALDPATAARYTELLDVDGVLDVIPVSGVLRTNVAVVTPAGVVTKVNGPGPRHSPETVSMIRSAIRTYLDTSSWLVLSGSLPPGCPAETYGEIIAEAREFDCAVALDADADALRHGVAAGPSLVKPNLAELEDLHGDTITTLGDAHVACAALVASGVGTVLCSLGPDGALAVTPTRVLHAASAPAVVGSTVGAGDALLAGFIAANGDLVDQLRRAVAWGTAACRLPGSQMPANADIDTDVITVTDTPDWARVLTRNDSQQSAEAA